MIVILFLNIWCTSQQPRPEEHGFTRRQGKLCYTVGFFTNTAIRWDDTLSIYDRGYELVLLFDDC